MREIEYAALSHHRRGVVVPPVSRSPRPAVPARTVDPAAERVARAQRLWTDAMVAASKAKAHEEDTWRRYKLEKATAGR
jgi:hypothetical protein